VNGNENDAVLFTGNGSTAAINHIVKSMDFDYDKDNSEIQHNFCQVNRWKTMDCTLCTMSFANQGQYEAHESSQIHQDNYEKYLEKEKKSSFTEPPI
jgi:hypothetical protein